MNEDIILYRAQDGILYQQRLYEGKEYTVYVAGNSIRSLDMIIPVTHKKKVSFRHWKDIGSKMIIWRGMMREPLAIYAKLLPEVMLFALGMFSQFDEKTGAVLPFLFRYTQDDAQTLCQIFSQYTGTDVQLSGVVPIDSQGLATINTIHQITSILYGLALTYGTMDIRDDKLYGIKIHIPLFGQYLVYSQHFDVWIDALATEYGIYVDVSQQKSSYGISYQMSISDEELLECMGSWYNNSVASIKKIRTKEWADTQRSLLEEFFAQERIIVKDSVVWYKPLQIKR